MEVEPGCGLKVIVAALLMGLAACSNELQEEPVDVIRIADGETVITAVIEPTGMPVYEPPALFPTLTPAPVATEEPPLAPPPRQTMEVAAAAQLSEAEMNRVLELGGWPYELVVQAKAVAWCESRWSPGSEGGSDNVSFGLFRLWLGWFEHSGLPRSMWADPVTNAKAAYGAYRYDIDRGLAPWTQWTCKP